MPDAPPDAAPASARATAPSAWSRLARLAARTALIGLAIAAGAGVLPWIAVLYERTMPRAWERALILGVLHAARWSYLALLVLAPLGLALGAAGIVRARRRKRPWQGAGRLVVASAAFLLMIPPAELVASAWLRVLYRLPRLPERFAAASREGELSLVVIGGSTAEGHPYHPRVSIGRIFGWWLEERLPGRRVAVDVRASGGLCLEQAVLYLKDLERRPDAILIYSGHNEFQARYGWSRDVRHYLDDGELAIRSRVGNTLRSVSSVGALIERSIDANGLDRPPPPRVTRTLVERPAFTRDEYAFLLEDFTRRLDAVLAYCRRIGALPIVVVPSSNLSDYPPARSYLDPTVTADGRARAEAAFRAARDREASDPLAAARAYRDLLDRHPTFAEAHYRLARLLDRSGRFDEAARHYTHARDFDGMPMRCPGDFEDACRRIARRHGAVLIDGPSALARLCPGGIPGDPVFHDAHHPTLRGYVALAQAVVDGLAAGRHFGLTPAVAAPRIDPATCAARFGIDAAWWETVCMRSADFWARTAFMRHDPGTHLAMADRYARAAARLREGAAPQDLGLPEILLGPITDTEGRPPRGDAVAEPRGWPSAGDSRPSVTD